MNDQYYLIMFQPLTSSVISPQNIDDVKVEEKKFYEKNTFIGLALIIIFILLIMK